MHVTYGNTTSAPSPDRGSDPAPDRGSDPRAVPLFILGATASGKHEAAVEAAERLGAEIVSIDAYKVYRDMDVGTAKPGAALRRRVRHHLIDICEPSEAYNAGRFVRDAAAVAAPRLVFVGGTSLYYRAWRYGIFQGPPADLEFRAGLEADPAKLHAMLARVDPAAAKRLHPNDTKRLVRALEVHRATGRPLSELQTHSKPARPGVAIVIRRADADLRARIERRADRMLHDGLVAEARALRDPSREARNAIGYREALTLPPAQVRDAVVRRTWRFTRRQNTWFRSFAEAHWVDASPTLVDDILSFYTSRSHET